MRDISKNVKDMVLGFRIICAIMYILENGKKIGKMDLVFTSVRNLIKLLYANFLMI